jgi:uncharacterized membrane protein
MTPRPAPRCPSNRVRPKSSQPPGIFRWTQSSGAVVLPSVQNQNGGVGGSVTTNGLTVVGVVSAGGSKGFIWTQSGGSATYDGGLGNTSLKSISGDGTKIVGHTSDAQNHVGFVYYPHSGLSFALPGFNDFPMPFPSAISEDGSTIVGGSSNGSESRATAWYGEVVFWPISLGVLSGATHSSASAVSKDGSVIVGSSGSRAFRWSQAGGMTDIGGGSAYGVSGDGNFVVGLGGSATDGAFVWDSTNGMRNLQHVLTNNYGLTDALTNERSVPMEAPSLDKAPTHRGKHKAGECN